MKLFKRIILVSIIVFSLIFPIGVSNLTYAGSSPAPTFEKDFAKKITKWDEKVFTISCIETSKTLKDNIKCLLFPGNSWGVYWWVLWDIIKWAGYIVVFICLVINGIKLIMSRWKDDEMKQAITNILYILIWSVLLFGAMWLFWGILNGIFNATGTQDVSDRLIKSDSLLHFVLSFLKWAAFFVAIIMIVIAWFKMINPQTWDEWGGAKIAKSLVNVIVALIWIKVVDFIYYIASAEDFASQAWNFIVKIAKFLWYISGTVIVFMIIYSWYLLAVDWWSWDNFKKAKNILINIVLAVVALFFFLFLLYQIFSEFTNGNFVSS